MAFGNLVRFALHGFREGFTEQIFRTNRFEKDNVTGIFLIAEHDVNRAVTPQGFSIWRRHTLFGQFPGNRMEASSLKISGIYLADDFSFIRLDRQFSIFIMLISIAAPTIETRGSILSALGHAPFDILTARFIVRLGDSTEDRDYSSYRTFSASNGEYVRSTTDFYTALEGEGFTRQKTRSGMVVKGIKLNPTGADPRDEFPDFLT